MAVYSGLREVRISDREMDQLAAARRNELLARQAGSLADDAARRVQLLDDGEEARAADEARAAEYRRQAIRLTDKARRYRRTVPRVIRPGATRTPRARRAVRRSRSRSPGRLPADDDPPSPSDLTAGHDTRVAA